MKGSRRLVNSNGMLDQNDNKIYIYFFAAIIRKMATESFSVVTYLDKGNLYWSHLYIFAGLLNAAPSIAPLMIQNYSIAVSNITSYKMYIEPEINIL